MPKGIPSSGEFASDPRAESEVELSASDSAYARQRNHVMNTLARDYAEYDHAIVGVKEYIESIEQARDAGTRPQPHSQRLTDLIAVQSRLTRTLEIASAFGDDEDFAKAQRGEFFS